MLAQLATLPTPDCGPGFTSGTDCEEETVQTYTGSVELNIAPGDILAINGSGGVPLKVLVTEGGANGKGLLYYNAFGGVTIPVNFVGIQAWEAPNGVGGCVYAGEMPVAGIDNSVLDKDVQSQVLALYGKINDPNSFSGSFGQALDKVKELGETLKAEGSVDWLKAKTLITAVNVGFEEWKTETSNYFTKDGGTIPSVVNDILTSMQTKQGKFEELSACIVENVPAGGAGDAAPLIFRRAMFACELTDADKEEMISSRQDADDYLEELSLYDTDPDPIGPIFDINTGNTFARTLECSMCGKIYFIEPSKLSELEAKYGKNDPVLGLLVPSKVYKKYGEGKLSTTLASELLCPNPSQEIINILAETINYIVSKTPMNNFTDVPSSFMTTLWSEKISTYFCEPQNCTCIGTNEPSNPSLATLAETNSEIKKITFNLLHTKPTLLITTVENIQCVFIHEYVGHVVRGIGNAEGHHKAYDIQKQYINYQKTTPNFKEHVEERRAFYFDKYK